VLFGFFLSIIPNVLVMSYGEFAFLGAYNVVQGIGLFLAGLAASILFGRLVRRA
jgi:hypothetical protein